MEIRMKCKVCGKIYCYSDQDVKDNKTNATLAAISAVGAIASVFGGTRLDTYALNSQGDRYSDKIVDYTKCPFCHSSSTEPLSDSEWEAIKKESETETKIQAIQSRKLDINSNATAESLQKRVKMFLEDEDWDSAAAYCEQILDIDPECAMAYVYKLMIEKHVSTQDGLASLSKPFEQEKAYQKAWRFADDELREILTGYNQRIAERNRKQAYESAKASMDYAHCKDDWEKIITEFTKLGDYLDSAEKVALCKYKEAINIYDNAKTEEEYLRAKECFDSLGDYKDACLLSRKCLVNADEAKNDSIYDNAIIKVSSDAVDVIEKAIEELEKIRGWRDSDQKILEARTRIEQLIKQRSKRVKCYLFSSIGIIVCFALALVLVYVIIPTDHYNSALKLKENGQYEEAILAFEALKGYKDSAMQIEACYDGIKESKYVLALELEKQKKYKESIDLFRELVNYKDSYDQIEACINDYKDDIIRILSPTEVGETIIFGSYDQNQNLLDGKEPMEWLVIGKENDRLLVVSKYGLTNYKRYDSYFKTWDSCELREWLNNEFYEEVFTDWEKRCIITINQNAGKNKKYKDSEVGKNVDDKVFLLCIDEAIKYFQSNEERICDYNRGWWLRSPGAYNQFVAYVDENGEIDYTGSPVTAEYLKVRPAAWLTIKP